MSEFFEKNKISIIICSILSIIIIILSILYIVKQASCAKIGISSQALVTQDSCALQNFFPLNETTCATQNFFPVNASTCAGAGYHPINATTCATQQFFPITAATCKPQINATTCGDRTKNNDNKEYKEITVANCRPLINEDNCKNNFTGNGPYVINTSCTQINPTSCKPYINSTTCRTPAQNADNASYELVNVSTCTARSICTPVGALNYRNCKDYQGSFWIDTNNVVHSLGTKLTSPLLLVGVVELVVSFPGVVFIKEGSRTLTYNSTSSELYTSATTVAANGILCYDYRYVFKPPSLALNQCFYYNPDTGHYENGYAPSTSASTMTSNGNLLLLPVNSDAKNYMIFDRVNGFVLNADPFNNTVSFYDIVTATITYFKSSRMVSTLASNSYSMNSMTSNGIIWCIANRYVMATNLTNTRLRDWNDGRNMTAVSCTTNGAYDFTYAQTNSTLTNSLTSFTFLGGDVNMAVY